MTMPLERPSACRIAMIAHSRRGWSALAATADQVA
jgi:hypothetical protein